MWGLRFRERPSGNASHGYPRDLPKLFGFIGRNLAIHRTRAYNKALVVDWEAMSKGQRRRNDWVSGNIGTLCRSLVRSLSSESPKVGGNEYTVQGRRNTPFQSFRIALSTDTE